MSEVLFRVIAAFSLALAAPASAHGGSSVQPMSDPPTSPSVTQAPSANSRPSDSEAAVRAKLLGLAQEWVTTWNVKDVDRMQQLHDRDFLYGIFGRFMDGQELLKQIRKENFWGVTYSLRMVDPRVRILSPETALVLFQLVGKSVGPTGERPYASLFTLVYQKRGDDWKIVHVHDSEAPESSS